MGNTKNIQLSDADLSVESTSVSTEHLNQAITDLEITTSKNIAQLIKGIEPAYEDITNRLIDYVGDQYAFSESDYENLNNETWFTEASFWPYKDDSSNNLLHNISYAYTDSNTEETLCSLIGKPTHHLKEHSACENTIAFRNPETNTVSVMGGPSSVNEIHTTLISHVFQPELHVVVEYKKTLYKITITAKALSNPYRDSPHNLTDVHDEHISHVEQLCTENKHAKWVPCDMHVRGPLKPLLH